MKDIMKIMGVLDGIPHSSTSSRRFVFFCASGLKWRQAGVIFDGEATFSFSILMRI
jgi:hypothetical protein